MIKEFGYEYDATLNKELWNKCRGKVTHEKLWDAICLRSGRDTLKTIAREYKPTTVFMPALACDSMVFPFEMYGHNVTYYKLKEDYTVDIAYLNTVINDGIFLYMDYFGVRSISDENLEKLRIKYPKLIFVEDRTHNLIWDRDSCFQPDYIMASLRKWVNVPDGGLLWTKQKLINQQFGEDVRFSEKRLEAQCMRNKYFLSGDEKLKNEYRQIFSTVSEIMDEDRCPVRMTDYAYNIAKSIDWTEIRIQRQENARCLINILQNAGVQFIQNNTGISDLYVAFNVGDRNIIQTRLSAKGIFNTVIWPLNDEQKSVCEIAKYTEEHMLAAPCDQRYSVKDMEYIGNEIVKVIANS